MRGRARTAGQQREPVTQAIDDLVKRHRPQPRSRQLDRQRQTVQPFADLGHCGGVVVGEAKVRPDSLSPVAKHLNGFIAQ
ncbi:Uncharacterised protein [Mycobacterium tuberculosis]|nr:Uncharacterised protein [Mycobacterium tuberculosis]COX73465.1 Uncharacterised protein [Mycobacterium tuberculosis]